MNQMNKEDLIRSLCAKVIRSLCAKAVEALCMKGFDEAITFTSKHHDFLRNEAPLCQWSQLRHYGSRRTRGTLKTI